MRQVGDNDRQVGNKNLVCIVSRERQQQLLYLIQKYIVGT
jgi:hypothetical protein